MNKTMLVLIKEAQEDIEGLRRDSQIENLLQDLDSLEREIKERESSLNNLKRLVIKLESEINRLYALG